MSMDDELGEDQQDPSESLSLLFGVPLTVMAKLGQRRMSVREILSLTPNSIIELDRPAGMPIDVFANEKLIARGEIVVVNEVFGVRISELVSDD